LILINSFGSAIVLPHFSHFDVSNGSCIGIMAFTLGSGEGCSKKSCFSKKNQAELACHFLARYKG
jgi:hypothetical protein